MREQLKGRDFEEHKNWVFNTHPGKVPSFKQLMRAALIALVRCCTKIFTMRKKKVMGMNKRKKRKLDKENKLERMVLKTYYDFSNPGSYGGLERLHKATGVPVKKLKSIMRKNLIYSLHKPVRIRYTRNPTVANSIDHQWAADLADIKNLSRYNKGVKYLLTVVDVLSKYAWVVPMKNKTEQRTKTRF